jgi:hypothetical protein
MVAASASTASNSAISELVNALAGMDSQAELDAKLSAPADPTYFLERVFPAGERRRVLGISPSPTIFWNQQLSWGDLRKSLSFQQLQAKYRFQRT